MTVPDNPDAPHVLIFGLEAQLMELLPTGELSGNPLKTKTEIHMKKFADRAQAEAALSERIKDLLVNG